MTDKKDPWRDRAEELIRSYSNAETHEVALSHIESEDDFAVTEELIKIILELRRGNQ